MSVALPTKFSDGEEGITFSSEFAELYKSEDGDKLTIRGLALPFAETYQSPFADITFDEGAFDEALDAIGTGAKHAFLAADGHSLDAAFVLASTKLMDGEGSLKFDLDEDGLVFEAELSQTTIGKDIYHNIELGILDGVSVGITIEDYDEDFDEDEDLLSFHYKQVGLREVSLVSYPAFKQTRIDTKEMADFKDKFEETLAPADKIMAKIDQMNERVGNDMAEIARLLELADSKLEEAEKDVSGETESEEEEEATSDFSKFYTQEV